MGKKNLKRFERIEQIKQLFDVIGRGEVTAYDIAKVLGLSRSTWLGQMLDELVIQGHLQCRSVPHRKNIDKKLYRLSALAKVGGRTLS